MGKEVHGSVKVDTAHELYKAVRVLERAVDSLKALVRGVDEGEDLRYFYPNKSNRKTFEKKVAAFLKTRGGQALAGFDALVAAVLTGYGTVEKAKVVDDAAKAARKVAADLRAREREELGIDLRAKGTPVATVATYRALRRGFTPIEDALRTAFLKFFRDEYDSMTADLVAAGWDAIKAWPDQMKGFSRPPENFRHFFESQFIYPDQVRVEAVSLRKGINPDSVIALLADSATEDEVGSFAAKMAGKIDGVIHEECKGAKVITATLVPQPSIWEGSILNVTVDAGSHQKWHTKVISNFSKYSRRFLQYPTRRET